MSPIDAHLRYAREIAAEWYAGRKPAIQVEVDLLELGFYNIQFPNRGPIKVAYLGNIYELPQ